MVLKRFLLPCLLSIALLPAFVAAESQETTYNQEIPENNSKVPEESPWDKSFNAQIAYLEKFYSEKNSAGSVSEHGQGMQFYLEGNIDYNSGNYLHTLSLSLSTDLMITNDMPSIDTTRWSVSPAIEYTFFLTDLLFNVGTEFNVIEGDSLNITPYTWTELTLLRTGNQKFGTILWAYYRNDGYLTSTLYAFWRYKLQARFNSTVMAGAKFDADSSASYTSMYWNKWLGPTLRTRFVYDFNDALSLTTRLNLFYGFAIDQPYESGKDMQKFTSTIGATLNWKLKPFCVFAGIDWQYRRYIKMPDYYATTHSKTSDFIQIKIGTNIDF